MRVLIGCESSGVSGGRSASVATMLIVRGLRGTDRARMAWLKGVPSACRVLFEHEFPNPSQILPERDLKSRGVRWWQVDGCAVAARPDVHRDPERSGRARALSANESYAAPSPLCFSKRSGILKAA